jgi:ABC-2 type transport system ATP-binding protein
MIHVEQVRKGYHRARALDGFDLHVEKGDLFGLVGPNGAGKTTLIKILSTLIQPDAGSVRIAGLDVMSEPRDVKRLIGYMPDQPGLYQDMRVREFLTFFCDAFRIPRTRQAATVETALSRSGLENRSQSFVEELSLGMKQRLFLAKTLLHEPQVLLLDEPATGLDPLARVDLRHQLAKLNSEGTTILISSHILNDLEEICSRVGFITNGKNLADASGQTVVDLRLKESGGRIYEVGVLGEIDAAAKLAGELPGVKVVNVRPSSFLLELVAEPSEIPDLLRNLLQAGVQIVKFDRVSRTLEDRYGQVFGAKSR